MVSSKLSAQECMEEKTKRLLARINRLLGQIQIRDGSDFIHPAKYITGEIGTFTIRGLKSYEEYDDEISELAVWIWSLKDHLKELAGEKGIAKKKLEEVVNNDKNLQICADLANTEKHGKLKESRSGLYAQYGGFSITLMEKGICNINTMLLLGEKGENIIIEPVDHNKIQIYFEITDKDGNLLGEAFEILNKALEKWEEIYDKIQKNEL